MQQFHALMTSVPHLDQPFSFQSRTTDTGFMLQFTSVLLTQAPLTCLKPSHCRMRFARLFSRKAKKTEVSESVQIVHAPVGRSLACLAKKEWLRAF